MLHIGVHVWVSPTHPPAPCSSTPLEAAGTWGPHTDGGPGPSVSQIPGRAQAFGEGTRGQEQLLWSNSHSNLKQKKEETKKTVNLHQVIQLQAKITEKKRIHLRVRQASEGQSFKSQDFEIHLQKLVIFEKGRDSSGNIYGNLSNNKQIAGL